MGAALRICQDLRKGCSHPSNSLAVAHLFSRVCPVQASLWRDYLRVAAPGPSERLALSGVEGIPARFLFRAV